MQTYYRNPYPDANPTRPALLSRALGIFAHVPGQWHNVPGYERCALFQCAETGLRLQMRSDSPGDKFQISQEFQYGPNGERYFYHGQNPIPSIGCSTARTDESIAADIARRLLPTAREQFPLETEQIAQWYAIQERREQARQLLAEVGQGSTCGHYREEVYGPKWKARTYSGETVELTLSGLDLETACAVLELIQQ